MPRRQATNGDGIKPLLQFEVPEKRRQIPAKTEIKDSTLTRAERYATWAAGLQPDANITLASVIELALEEVFRRDKNFLKHETEQDGAAPAPARAATSRQSAAAQSDGAAGNK